MTQIFSRVFGTGVGALAIMIGAAVYANDGPLSVNESGPVSVDHAPAPSNAAPAIGRSASAPEPRELRGMGTTYEVQTPSSVNESAPWLTVQSDSR